MPSKHPDLARQNRAKMAQSATFPVGSYELLMGQVRRAATRDSGHAVVPAPKASRATDAETHEAGLSLKRPDKPTGSDVRWQAWQWAVANRGEGGSLPSGKVIADQFGRHDGVGWSRHLALQATSPTQHPD